MRRVCAVRLPPRSPLGFLFLALAEFFRISALELFFSSRLALAYTDFLQDFLKSSEPFSFSSFTPCSLAFFGVSLLYFGVSLLILCVSLLSFYVTVLSFCTVLFLSFLFCNITLTILCIVIIFLCGLIILKRGCPLVLCCFRSSLLLFGSN